MADTITGALSAKDTLGVEHIIIPQTNISAVQGLTAEINKIIKAISTSGGTITLTKTDGTTLTATIGTATTSADGLLSKTDKTKLDGIATGANNYSLPTATSGVLGGVKIGSNITNSGGTISLSSANVTGALGSTPLYSLPTASTSTLGGVKVGSGLSISNGVLSSTVSGGGVTGVKGNSESTYRTGQVNITKANIGLDKVDNTADEDKTVAAANKLNSNCFLEVDLAHGGSTKAFDGTDDLTIGVRDILQIVNGGTGNAYAAARILTSWAWEYPDGSKNWGLLDSINLNELAPPWQITGVSMCLYWCNNCVNLPEGYSYGNLFVIFRNLSWMMQIFIAQQLGATKDGTIFIRTRSAQSWKKIEGVQI